MKTQRWLRAGCALVVGVALMGAADGRWLDRVGKKDHVRVNPLLRSPELEVESASAGAQLYHTECAKCHGDDGRGVHGRPAVIGRHVASATDGDLFWLMTNGNPWKGMPPWMMLPAQERWQLVTYLRSINATPSDAASSNATSSNATLTQGSSGDGASVASQKGSSR